MGQCGERYKHLLVVDGNPSDTPCGLLTLAGGGCSMWHAKAWEARADEVWYLVRASWNRLVQMENERKSWADSTQLRAQVEEFERASAEMQRWSWTGLATGELLAFNKQVVASAINVISLGACALDRLNAAIENIGGGAGIEPGMSPETPSIFPSGDGGGIMLIAAVGLAAFMFMESRR
jgi:hypothetical protein